MKKMPWSVVMMLVFVLLLLLGRQTLWQTSTVDFISLCGGGVILIDLIGSLLRGSRSQKRIFLPRTIGYGWGLNPYQPLGLAIYLMMIGLLFVAAFFR